tara:strand:+ start:7848 stop:8237 length:390 start_codon:yes stop_codon:yes gene_type:complete
MNATNNLEKKFVSAIYDFTDDGSAYATAGGVTSLATTSIVPVGSLINSVLVETKVLNASGGASTMLVTIGGVNVTGAMSIANRSVTTPYVTLAAQDITTSTDPIKVTLGTADLNAGKCRIIIGYFDPIA